MVSGPTIRHDASAEWHASDCGKWSGPGIDGTPLAFPCDCNYDIWIASERAEAAADALRAARERVEALRYPLKRRAAGDTTWNVGIDVTINAVVAALEPSA